MTVYVTIPAQPTRGETSGFREGNCVTGYRKKYRNLYPEQHILVSASQFNYERI